MRPPLFPTARPRVPGDESQCAPLPDVVTPAAGRAAQAVLAVAVEELGIAGLLPDVDRTRFLWRAAEAIDVEIAEALDEAEGERVQPASRRQEIGKVVLVVGVVLVTLIVGMWISA